MADGMQLEVEEEAREAESPDAGRGCLSALLVGIVSAALALFGCGWLIILYTPLPILDWVANIGETVAYAFLVGVPGLLVALFVRSERFALWRGVGLALTLTALQALAMGLVLAVDNALAYPGLPGGIQPAVSLLVSAVILVLGKRWRSFRRPTLRPVLIGAALATLASAGWVVVGVVGTAPELALAVAESLALGLAAALALLAVFAFDTDILRRMPFWSIAVGGFAIAGVLPGLLAARGWAVQGLALYVALIPAGFFASLTLTLAAKPDVRPQLWAAWATLAVALFFPLALTEGLESEWMLEQLPVLWRPAILVGLLAGSALGWMAAAARPLLAKDHPLARIGFPAVSWGGAVVLVAGLYAFAGQPGVQPQTFFVVMADQADTSFAADIEDRGERVTAVYETLTEHALDSQADIRAFLGEQGAPYTPYYLVNGIQTQGGAALRRQLLARDDVARILDNPQARPLPGYFTPEPLLGRGDGSPVDLSWGVDEIDAERVWEDFGVTGEGIIVGSADTGVNWQHPALRDNYVGRDGNQDYAWFDPWEGAAEPFDDNGHGTHTTGTVAGAGGIGVAPGVEWIACRNLGRNLGNPGHYLDCMQFLFAPFPVGGDPFTDGDPTRGAHVTNNSWGCPPQEGCDGLTLPIAVEHLRDAGQMFVVSAGNEGPLCDTVDSPALADAAFTVGASNSDDEVANFSSRGPSTDEGEEIAKPDVVAPGVDVRSSVPDGTYNGFGWSGTSMAGPHVAGVVALMWSANPDLIGDIDTTEQLIIESADHVNGVIGDCGGSGGQDNEAGFGRVDAYAAVEAALTLED